MKSFLEWKQDIVIRILKKSILKLLLISLMFTTIVIFLSVVLKAPTYKASGQMVQNDNNYGLVSSYEQFVSSTGFKTSIDNRIEKSNWKNYSKKSEYDIQLSSEVNSPFFTVSAISDNGNYSKFLANAALKVLISNMGKYLAGVNISVVSNVNNYKKNSIKKFLISVGMITFVVAFVVAALISILFGLFFGTVKNEVFLSEILGLHKLGLLTIEVEEK